MRRPLVSLAALAVAALALTACDQNMDSGNTNSLESACQTLAAADLPTADQILRDVDTALATGDVSGAVEGLNAAQQQVNDQLLPTSNNDVTPALDRLAEAIEKLRDEVAQLPEGTPVDEQAGERIKPRAADIIELDAQLNQLCA